ncbi:MAG: hypothetical protein AAF696_13550, partial [Bacteroidota bacterium]
AGYQAALQQMFPRIAPGKLTALCVSEANGSHPKAIETTLTNNQVSGLKTYLTAGSDVEELLVLCKSEEIVGGRPLLKLVHLSAEQDQLEIENFELAFMKEIKHGKLKLNEVAVKAGQILAGDGFQQYSKPFRTLEDICVGAAYQAMLLRQAMEHEWEEGIRDRLAFQLFSLGNLLKLVPSDAETHLLLAVCEKNFEVLLGEIEPLIASASSPGFREDWEQNKRLISMAKKVKEIRLEKARRGLFSSSI